MIEAAVGVLLIRRAPLLPNLTGLLVVLAVMTLIGGLLFRRPGPVAWSIGLLGAAYGLSLIGDRGRVDAISLLVAAALFLAAEAAYLAVETEVFSGMPIHRLLASVAVAMGSAVIGVLLLAIGQSFLVAAPVVTAGGVAATLVLLGLLITAATRRASP
jgi:hypothetical protein